MNEVGTMTVKELVTLVKTGVIETYKNNRGDGLLKERKVRRYMDNWNRYSAGRLNLAEFGSKLRISDGHHRIAALTRGYDAGIISGEEPVSYCVMPQDMFMQSYIQANEMGISHRNRAKLLNPDLAVGSFITPFLSKEDIELKGKFLSQLANIVYCFKNNEPMDYVSVYKARSKIRELLDVEAGSAPIFPKSGDAEIREAVRYYKDVITTIKSRFAVDRRGSAIMDQTTLKILGNASAFGIIVADKLSVRPAFTARKAERLADKILAKNGELLKLLLSVTSSSEERQRDTHAKIVKVLK